MISSLLEFSLRQRILVLGLACLLSVAGVFAFQSIPIDAYPDVTNIQVQVLTDAQVFRRSKSNDSSLIRSNSR